jgi:hypothetical protein
MGVATSNRTPTGTLTCQENFFPKRVVRILINCSAPAIFCTDIFEDIEVDIATSSRTALTGLHQPQFTSVAVVYVR